MGDTTGLLGVGDGVTKPEWLGQGGVTQERDNRIVKSSVSELVYAVTPYSQTVDLASIGANSVSQVDISVTTVGKVEANDYAVFAGAALPYGILVQGILPAPANDTLRLRVMNVTAGAIDPSSMTFYFLLYKAVAR